MSARSNDTPFDSDSEGDGLRLENVEESEGGCALLAVLSGVLEPDLEQGITGDFAVYTRDSFYSAVAFPLIKCAQTRATEQDEAVLFVSDFALPWAVGSFKVGDTTFGMVWKYCDRCVCLDNADLRIALSMPEETDAVPLYLPAFRVDLPFQSSECRVTMLDIHSEGFRACGYAKLGDSIRALLWSRGPRSVDRPAVLDFTDQLSPEVREHFTGALGFMEDGQIEVLGDRDGNSFSQLLKL